MFGESILNLIFSTFRNGKLNAYNSEYIQGWWVCRNKLFKYVDFGFWEI